MKGAQLGLFDAKVGGEEVARFLSTSGREVRVDGGLAATGGQQRLLEGFEVLADASGGIKKLRELILELAVRGRLVAQDQKDESARVALTLVAKDQSWRVGVGRAGKLQGQYNEEPVDMLLPVGWSLCKLDDCLELINGRAYAQSELLAEGVPVIRIQNLNGGDRWYYSDLELAPEKYCCRGDLLFAWSASFGPYIWQGPRAIYHYHIWKVNLSKAVDKKFAYYLLSQLTDRIKLESHGLAMLHMTKAKMEALRVALPPLAEQGRIVARIDEFMSLCHSLEAHQTRKQEIASRLNRAALDALAGAEGPEELAARWRRVAENTEVLLADPSHLRQFRQAILKLAVQGKLTTRAPEDGLASDVLKQVEEKRKKLSGEGKASRQEPLLALDAEAVPFTIPDTWLWTRLANVTICRDSQRVPVSKDQRQDRHGPYDYYGASGVIDTIDSYIFDEPLLLVGEDGANLLMRSTPIAFLATGKYWVNNHAHVLDGASPDALRYVAVFINAIDLAPFVTGTAQPKMNQAKMNSIPVAIPPLAEQRRIVAKVDLLMSLCDDLEAKLRRAEEGARRLAEALVAEVLA